MNPAAFIQANLVLQPAPAIPELSLYTARPASRVSRLAGDVAPYWAYGWAGGTVLARYVLDHPDVVAGRRILDIGSGSGIVAIAAMRAGATSALAVEIDPHAVAAIDLNAAANGVKVTASVVDLTAGDAPDVDLILGGDVFYDVAVAERMIPFFDRCHRGGLAILVGDPGRMPLPVDRLQAITHYHVPDFGDASAIERPSAVYSWLLRA